MKNKILSEIYNAPTTKEKTALCADKIQTFLGKISPELRKDFFEIEDMLSEYDIYIQDEIFKRLL